jgi:hypothetical protein
MSIARILDRLFEKRVIVNCAKEPYLHRWYIFRSEPLGIFVHRFVRSDEDRALHDHPWSFIVIPLWGGYVEHSDRAMTKEEQFCATLRHVDCWSFERFLESLKNIPTRIAVKRRVWPIISTRYRNTEYRHRVELVGGRHSWSLFIRFKKVREWGFWPTDGFIRWNKWWQDKCE